MLDINNTAWCSTVVANGSLIGLVVYTGPETRSSMNTTKASYKVGVTDNELNNIALYLIVFMAAISMVILIFRGFDENSVVIFFRYILLLSTIIPISLRVNLDMAKIAYTMWFMKHDP